MVYCWDHSSTLPALQAHMEGNAGWAGADHSSTLPAPQAHMEENAGWKQSIYCALKPPD